jgi:hypothetical protein
MPDATSEDVNAIADVQAHLLEERRWQRLRRVEPWGRNRI